MTPTNSAAGRWDELDRDILSRFEGSGASTWWLGRHLKGNAMRPIRRRLHAMKDAGLVDKISHHGWRITDAGRAVLTEAPNV